MKISRKTTTLCATGVAALLFSHASMAVNSAYTEHNETRAYAGFQWFMGETSLTKPNVVLGLRKTTTDIKNKVTGYDLSYTYSIEKSQSDAFRAGYLDGCCCKGQAIAGVGYSFNKDTVLGFGGIVDSHAKVFGEIDSNKNLGTGLELNTLRCAGDRNVVAQ